MGQTIIYEKGSYKKIHAILNKLQCKKYLLVRDSAFLYLGIKDYFTTIGVPFVPFDDFKPNPLYEDVCKGVGLFHEQNCDAIIAVGGGSAIDVAKCIKLFCGMKSDMNYLEQSESDTGVPLIAVPTTAGTGSESTKYAVIYYHGEKQSISHESIVPDYAILESSLLKTLPVYQKKCTMLDALCQGIESWWSVNSTDESKKYSEIAVKMIMSNKDAYINDNSDEAAKNIMLAANYAGRAINIAQTTAAHAMSYKLTSLYGLPHGHAVAICLPAIWDYMLKHVDDCVDERGIAYLNGIFANIAVSMGCEMPKNAIETFSEILTDLEIQSPKIDRQSLDVLVRSVNPIRLKNNPVALDEMALTELYTNISAF